MFYLHLVELKLRYLSGGSRSPQRVLSTLSGIETIASLDTPRILAIIVLSTFSGIEINVKLSITPQKLSFYLHLVELKPPWWKQCKNQPNGVLSTLSGIETRVVKQFLGRGEVSFIST